MVEEALSDIGIADRSKDPEHSCGSPAITSGPEVPVLAYTELDVFPQLCGGILKVITVQSTLIVSDLQERDLIMAMLVGTEVGNEWGSHVYEVRPIARDNQNISSIIQGALRYQS